MHAADVRKNRSASRSCSVDDRFRSMRATYLSTAIVSSPEVAGGGGGGGGGGSAPSLPSSPSTCSFSPPFTSWSSRSLRLRRALFNSSTPESDAAFAVTTTCCTASRSTGSPLRASMVASSTKMSTALCRISAIVSSWSSPSSSFFSPTACRRYMAMPQHSSVFAALGVTGSSPTTASRSLHSVRPMDRCASSGSRSAIVLSRNRSTSSSTERLRPAAPCSDELSDIALARYTPLCVPWRHEVALARPMHPAVCVLGILALCALLCQSFRRCARSQRSVFVDRERGHVHLVTTRFSYQALPTTVV